MLASSSPVSTDVELLAFQCAVPEALCMYVITMHISVGLPIQEPHKPSVLYEVFYGSQKFGYVRLINMGLYYCMRFYGSCTVLYLLDAREVTDWWRSEAG